ncbi:hypothetical protein QEG98_28025 [Myxococcus sp. MxC21-1]|uniref:hypothetical protein n=1 Tax=Myxococcus sp. MxC21-1 TaxID=3041439 RepID=UPI0029303E14|nr:hypothetical protein [Myxococcus sp. MxC21-1]WNZ59853.1 hypothetical protein QEG98_28025 [Myxococcus sp. MxC21-1]
MKKLKTQANDIIKAGPAGNRIALKVDDADSLAEVRLTPAECQTLEDMLREARQVVAGVTEPA